MLWLHQGLLRKARVLAFFSLRAFGPVLVNSAPTGQGDVDVEHRHDDHGQVEGGDGRTEGHCGLDRNWMKHWLSGTHPLAYKLPEQDAAPSTKDRTQAAAIPSGLPSWWCAGRG